MINIDKKFVDEGLRLNKGTDYGWLTSILMFLNVGIFGFAV